jgi:hypothetical protein
LPCPDVARWVSAARLSGGKTAAVTSHSRAASTGVRRRFKGGFFLCLFTFSKVTDAGILIKIFYLTLFKAIFVNILISVVTVVR